MGRGAVAPCRVRPRNGVPYAAREGDQLGRRCGRPQLGGNSAQVSPIPPRTAPVSSRQAYVDLHTAPTIADRGQLFAPNQRCILMPNTEPSSVHDDTDMPMENTAWFGNVGMGSCNRSTTTEYVLSGVTAGHLRSVTVHTERVVRIVTRSGLYVRYHVLEGVDYHPINRPSM